MAFLLFSHLALFWFTSIKKLHRFSLWLPGKPAMIVRTTYTHKHIYLLLFICSISSSMNCQIDYVCLCYIYTHAFHLFLGLRFDVFRCCVWKHCREVVATNRFFTHATDDGKMRKEPEQKIWQTSMYMSKATSSATNKTIRIYAVCTRQFVVNKLIYQHDSTLFNSGLRILDLTDR